MNWFKQNIFATVLAVVTLLGAGALLFLASQAGARSAAAQETFASQKAEYDRLTGEPIYPNQANLKKLQEQRKAYEDRANTLKGEIAKLQLPLENISPNQFQEELSKASRDVLVRAAANRVEIPEPERFFLGFEAYRDRLPPEAAVAELNVVFRAILDTVNKLIDARVSRIDSVTRIPLASEGGAPATPPPAQGRGRGTGSGSTPSRKVEARKVLDRSTYTIVFTGPQAQVQSFLNAATAGPQLVTMQLVRLQNEQLRGPARGAGTTQGGEATPTPEAQPAEGQTTPEGGTAEAAPAPTPPEQMINFILGEEKVNATVRFQIIRVIPDAPAKS